MDRRKAPLTRPSVMPTPTSSLVDEAILKGISALVILFSGLDGKLGHFGVIWEKVRYLVISFKRNLISFLARCRFSAYLSRGAGDQDVSVNSQLDINQHLTR